MPRKARDERLDTRTARDRLAPRREPYWRNIQEGRAIGYRRAKGGKAGSWIARWYEPDRTPSRAYHALGAADDLLDADGAITLSFGQAQEAGRKWFAEMDRAGGRIEAPITVQEVAVLYIDAYRARGGKSLRDTQRSIDAHILPALGDKLIAKLTPAIISGWHRDLANSPARLRSKMSGPRNSRKPSDTDQDGQRARRATANRLLTVLKAVLNFALHERKVLDDLGWRSVKPFPSVQAPRIRYLNDGEANRLANACPADLRLLVTAALLTGCRYGELITLRPVDLDLAAGILSVVTSKSGKPRSVVLTAEAQDFFRNVASGVSSHEIVFRRNDGEPWGDSHQFRPLRKACEAAKITPAVSFHILRHTHASRLAMAGVPLAVIAAQLGHADLRITGQHYAHLSPGYVADTIRAAFAPLGIVSATNVKPIRTSRSG